jgi:hypothetical protein
MVLLNQLLLRDTVACVLMVVLSPLVSVHSSGEPDIAV